MPIPSRRRLSVWSPNGETAIEHKAEVNWKDDDPDWEHVKDTALAPILKQCKYYFEFKPVFSPHHGNTRLAPTNSTSKLVNNALAFSSSSQLQDPMFEDSESLHDPEEHLDDCSNLDNQEGGKKNKENDETLDMNKYKN
ncbi:hypothetical protein CROQUDRAFT_100111 [Cronartium quercuum f. sp. fusiforme G11]|uniref:Uncharacterized protein n=1 Tax=Cronartium quercuum f. sp. fusiforme G11 TaxID=708437 RepID=A0A9P6T6D0_9BASI|nr:hypothetical protein CROQUDRAFT_100111 [Cronartium quercuum f. sp. fusiforme G11]